MLYYCTSSKQTKNMDNELQSFIKKHIDTLAPISKEANLAYWDAAISGDEDNFRKAADLEIILSKLYSDKHNFAKLKTYKDSGEIKDKSLKRQMDVLYDLFLENQIEDNKLEEMINLSMEIEKKFSTFRAEIDEQQLTDNEVEEILRKSNSSDEVKKAWLASKKIGKVVADDIKKIVKLRNEAAKELGFDNYHQMQLNLSEQNPEQIKILFDELDSLTRDAFKTVKNTIDGFLAAHFSITKEELMPWHYQNRFFQEAPAIYEVDLDKYYKDKDLVELTTTYYNGIGLPIDDMVKNSDLFEKEGKNQHAFCTDIDKEGDVRVLCNIKPNSYWMNTMLHEYGHAVYDKYMDLSTPYILREPAHIFTTEAIAMLFGRFASNATWIKDMTGIPDEETRKIRTGSYNMLKLEQLVFSRWAQVMYRFEKSMYENPEQDLNKLWRDLVENYQMIKHPVARNEPDWASKIHIATAPCYYHNYLMGELLASQLYFYITKEVLKAEDHKNQSFAGKPEVGAYLKKFVFQPARTYQWNTMIEKATGEKLTAKYYAKQFVEGS